MLIFAPEDKSAVSNHLFLPLTQTGKGWPNDEVGLRIVQQTETELLICKVKPVPFKQYMYSFSAGTVHLMHLESPWDHSFFSAVSSKPLNIF